MAKSKIIKTGKKIADSVVGGYEKIEKGVTDGYKKIEKALLMVTLKLKTNLLTFI